MIGRLSGTVVECSPERVLLDVAGVGYTLQIPLSTFYRISPTNGGEGRVSLHVHTHVREDALQLFGFFSLEERAVFEQLIAISGVGPRMALAILSGIGADELSRTVMDQDRARLEKIPGVGKKTAERVLLELKDRIDRWAGPAPDSGPRVVAAGRGSRDDAVSALSNLGYTRDRAQKAVDRAVDGLGDDASLEAVLKAALSGLVR